MGQEAVTDQRRVAEILSDAAALGDKARAGAQAIRAALGAATADVQVIRDQAWDNYFRTVHVDRVARQVFVSGNLADGVKSICDLVLEAGREKARVRAVGSSWSFSPIVATEGWIVSLRGMRGLAPSLDGSLCPGIAPGSVAHVLAGTIVHDLNETLQAQAQSLIVMGGNGGQTIAGATATGTHGGWLGCPSISDYIRGVGFVGADGKARWVESKTHPLTKPGFDGWGVYQVIRDDTMLHAAQASLGLLGVVTSIAIEVRPLYFVNWERRWHAFDDALQRAAFDHDFSGLGIAKPDHFLTVINPHEAVTEIDSASIEIGYRVPPIPGALIPISSGPPNDPAGGFDPWGLITQVVNNNPQLVPALLNIALPMSFPTSKACAALSQIWPRSVGGAPLISMELAVTREKARDTWAAIAKLLAASRQTFSWPGVFGVRSQKGTKALLGFTRFDDNITFELIYIRGANGVELFLKELDIELTARNVRHLFHPGQIERWDANRMRRLMAPGYDDMRDVMRSISPDSGLRFGNATTDRWGLSVA
jgi:FAD/FMN-containing dehydrogenase